jgi:hypothetical protein
MQGTQVISCLQPVLVVTLSNCRRCSSRIVLPELLGKSDENAFGPPDAAQTIHRFVPDHFADEFCAVFVEPGECVVDVFHGEHDSQVTERVHRGAAVIGDHGKGARNREISSRL